MEFNNVLLEIIKLDQRNNELLNEYSKKYQNLSVDKILEKLNNNEEFIFVSNKCNELREQINLYLKNNKIYLTGNQNENGFLIDVAHVIKDNSFAIYIYTDLSEIKDNIMYISISYDDLRDYLLANKEIKRIIVNKNTLNVVLGKSNFIRGNMFGLIIKNKLEIE